MTTPGWTTMHADTAFFADRLPTAATITPAASNVDTRLPQNAPRTVVKQYMYRMDGEHTGDLQLMVSSTGNKKCSWRSISTRLSTDWHGFWAADSEHNRLWVFFDYKGISCEKFATVDMLGEGKDYRGRRIQMTLLATWTFDALTSMYVLGS